MEQAPNSIQETVIESTKSDHIVEAVKEHLQNKQKKFNGSMLLISVILFAFIAMGHHTLLGIVYLILVILLHELGHFLGMKLFGYSNPRIFFIPGLGAAAGADSRSGQAWHEIIVLLLGPLPGLLLGIVMMCLSPLIPLPEKNSLILMLVFINAFNLLPFAPLDGGRIMSEALFRKKPILELLFKIIGIAALLGLAFAAQDIIWGLFILFFSFSLKESFKQSRATKEARDRILSQESELSEDDHIAIARECVRKEFSAQSEQAEQEVKTSPFVKLYCGRIAEVYRESKTQLMSKVGSIVTTITYIGIVGAAFIGILIGSVLMYSYQNDGYAQPDPLVSPSLQSVIDSVQKRETGPLQTSGEYFRENR